MGQTSAALQAAGVKYTLVDDWAKSAAMDVADGQVIGWFEGRSEIGPRALGHRSLVADPREAANWQRMNSIKGREQWRPLAPSVLRESFADSFIGLGVESPYMSFNATVKNGEIPAVTHVDGTARVQTVGQVGEYRKMLMEFDRLTGVPVVMNTSFNGPGEPIVDSPQDAVRFLMSSNIDALYIDGFRAAR